MRIMLFSDCPPCTNYSAGIVLNKMCSFLLDQGHSVCAYIVASKDISPEISDDKLRRMKFKSVDKPRENYGGGVSSFWHNGVNAHTILRQIGRDAAAFAQENDCDMFWVAEQGQSIIKTVHYIEKYSKLPYVIQTWDSPQWWMRANKYDWVTRRTTMNAYQHALQNAQCFIAASWIMESEFKEKYRCKRSKAVVLGFSEGQVKPYGKRDESKFTIALSGQIYAVEEYAALLRALHHMDWQCDGKQICLEIFTGYQPAMSLEFEVPAENVHLNGWLSQEDLLPRLADCDLLYCPYWFDKDYYIISHTSFPSKLSTYLKVGVPVAVHAPDYASPVIFTKKNNCAYHLDTLEPETLTKEMQAIMRDENRKALGERGYQAFLTYLTNASMIHDFFDALGLQVDETRIEKKEEPQKKVLQVNNIDLAGGRFNGYELMKYCTDNHLANMHQIVLRKESTNPNVIQLIDSQAAETVNDLCTAYESENCLRGMVQPFAKRIKETKEFQDADIVQYHLIHNGIFSYLDFPELTRLKPTVLTVHDPWLFTGHCVHPLDCEKWKTGCNHCPDLERDFVMQRDNTEMMWRVKKEIFKDVQLDFVAASNWMKTRIEASPITQHCGPVHLIPLGVDTRKFHPEESAQERARIRKGLGIAPEQLVLMFRQDLSRYKGMDTILRAVKRLKDLKHVTLLTVGATGTMQGIEKEACQVIEIPWQNDVRQLVQIYQAADVFLMPSIAESFGLMAVEAMACGKPLIVCEGTATAEICRAPEIGMLIQPGNDAQMAAAIEKLRANPEQAHRRGEAGTALVKEQYRFEDYVRRHLELYNEILSRRS